MSENLRLLAILAHPDDESLGVGSTLAKYAAEGVQTYLICATRGERGWMGDEKDDPGPVELGKIRELELQDAARVLGISQLFFLDYLDGDLDRADPVKAARNIARIIREHPRSRVPSPTPRRRTPTAKRSSTRSPYWPTRTPRSNCKKTRRSASK